MRGSYPTWTHWLFWGMVLAACAAAAASSGCAPRVVYVPTPVPCPQPPQLSHPELPISSLTGKESPGELLRAYGASLASEIGYARSLELILEGYRVK